MLKIYHFLSYNSAHYLKDMRFEPKGRLLKPITTQSKVLNERRVRQETCPSIIDHSLIPIIYKMLVTRCILILLAFNLTHQHPLFPKYSQLKNYELRRPLQYFFYLLELKSSFNPMLGGITNMGEHCSSKTGPFCKITNHQPFQSHAVRDSALNDQERAQAKQNFQLFDSMMKNEDMRFLIRNELANEFDNILKQKIGDRMHLQDMLSPEYFEEKR